MTLIFFCLFCQGIELFSCYDSTERTHRFSFYRVSNSGSSASKNLTIVFIKHKLLTLGCIKDFLGMRVPGFLCKLDFTG